MLKSFRYLLFPISLIYGAITWIRNWLFDHQILKSASFNFPIICVGNLAAGGTGKTPMTEYLVELLRHSYKAATLSRGYKRKTRGFAIANATTTAIDIGDEPMQFHQKYPELTVAVGEERLVAIPQLLHSRPDTQVILLDDAFQHRHVKAGMNILLTEFKNLYTRDLMLPAGDLRDNRSSSKRAQVIIVTKCKPNLSSDEREQICRELKPLPGQSVYFTKILYAQPYHLFHHGVAHISSVTDCLLICGIANPKPLMEYLTAHVHSYDMLRFPDHHIFTSDDLQDIIKQFERITTSNKMILTTEKDGVRLQKFARELSQFPIYVLPIKHSFLFEEGPVFDQQVISFIQGFDNRPSITNN